jgi:hypothetical protein
MSLESIKFDLESLFLNGIDLDGILGDAAKTSLLFQSTTKGYLALCDALIAEWNKIDPTVESVGPFSALKDVFLSLKNKPLYFTESSDHVQFKMVHFLCSQIKVRLIVLFCVRQGSMTS